MRPTPRPNDLPEAVRAMLRPATYPVPPGKVSMSQTHISWVFLTRDRVYKIKKPVTLDFLDFGSLRRRLHYCHREVKLNRRLAPDVYLGVVPLRHGARGWRLGGKAGRAREYVIEMRRLEAADCLVRMLEEGRAGLGETASVGRTLALFHRGARRSPAIARYGEPRRVRSMVLRNLRESAPFLTQAVGEAAAGSLVELTEEAIERHAAVIRHRMIQGRVLEGHGDLHARHVYLERGRVIILDGIEFNYRFLYQDAACDLAFLTMDLRSLGCPEHSTALVNAYLDHSGDYGMPLLLPLYESYRAVVRGKVAGITALAPVGAAARRRALAEAERYFALASRCLERGSDPRLVLMSGVSGSGKSTIARRLAARVGAVHLRSDTLRKAALGIAPEESVPRERVAHAYSPEMSRRVYREMARLAGSLLREGRSVVADATFLANEHRTRFLREAGVRPASALLAAIRPSAATARARLVAAARDETLSDADASVLSAQIACWESASGFPGPSVTIPPRLDPDAAARRIAGGLGLP